MATTYIVDKDGNQIKTAFTEAELKPKDGEKVIKQKYDGCPKHSQQNQDDDDFGFQTLTSYSI